MKITAINVMPVDDLYGKAVLIDVAKALEEGGVHSHSLPDVMHGIVLFKCPNYPLLNVHVFVIEFQDDACIPLEYIKFL